MLREIDVSTSGLDLLAAAAAEPIEQAAPAAALTRRLLGDLAVASAAGERILQLGLPATVAAAAEDRLALLLQLIELAARILHTGAHLQAFRTAHQPAPKNEETLIAARILHGRSRALIDAIGVLDLLLDPGQGIAAAATAALGGELLLQLHAADLLIAHRLGEREAGGACDHAGAEEAKRATLVAARQARGREKPTLEPLLGAHSPISPWRQVGHYAPLSLAVNAASIRCCEDAVLDPFPVYRHNQPMLMQPILMTFCGIIPG